MFIESVWRQCDVSLFLPPHNGENHCIVRNHFQLHQKWVIHKFVAKTASRHDREISDLWKHQRSVLYAECKESKHRKVCYWEWVKCLQRPSKIEEESAELLNNNLLQRFAKKMEQIINSAHSYRFKQESITIFVAKNTIFPFKKLFWGKSTLFKGCVYGNVSLAWWTKINFKAT